MTIKEFKRLLKQGIENNVVAYDKNTEGNTITRKLIFNMKIAAKEHGQGILQKVFIPNDVYPDFYEAFYWIDFNRCDFLDGGVNSEAVKLYLAEGGVMPFNTLSLLVGVCHNGYVILGAV